MIAHSIVYYTLLHASNKLHYPPLKLQLLCSCPLRHHYSIAAPQLISFWSPPAIHIFCYWAADSLYKTLHYFIGKCSALPCNRVVIAPPANSLHITQCSACLSSQFASIQSVTHLIRSAVQYIHLNN